MCNIIQKISPKNIFLIDAIGALASAIMLGIILPLLNHFIEMPNSILRYLSLIAFFFALNSFICYWEFPKKWRILLRIIASLNLLYALFTLSLLIYLYERLTLLDFLYFII